ncbi:hypothetical protein Cni_G16317 [Canna indica]|uniref:Reverse transcriptase domain-containing protein n=1 Tax=Canna indica TaxID=4628 RepID=A0AAQ3QFS1_9LILI|nr:hypothetical protein Cni_G16317 [Canna indica]
MKEKNKPIMKCLKSMEPVLKEWNKNSVGNLEKSLEETSRKLRELEFKEEIGALSEEDMLYMRSLSNKILALTRQIKMKWWSKSMKKWIEEGDKNTKYFHSSVMLRRKRNQIDMLIQEGKQLTEDKDIVEAFAEWYKILWKNEDNLTNLDIMDKLKWAEISNGEAKEMEKDLTMKEIRRAAFSLWREKSPGNDGYILELYLNNWDIVKENLKAEISTFMTSNILPEGWNNTVLTMIPKKENAKEIGDFRPIALCNNMYKILAKIIMNIIRPVLEKIISPAQSAFVPNRLSQDNIFVIAEIINSIQGSKAKKLFILVKLELQKAYDKYHGRLYMQ